MATVYTVCINVQWKYLYMKYVISLMIYIFTDNLLNKLFIITAL